MSNNPIYFTPKEGFIKVIGNMRETMFPEKIAFWVWRPGKGAEAHWKDDKVTSSNLSLRELREMATEIKSGGKNGFKSEKL